MDYLIALTNFVCAVFFWSGFWLHLSAFLFICCVHIYRTQRDEQMVNRWPSDNQNKQYHCVAYGCNHPAPNDARFLWITTGNEMWKRGTDNKNDLLYLILTEELISFNVLIEFHYVVVRVYVDKIPSALSLSYNIVTDNFFEWCQQRM